MSKSLKRVIAALEAAGLAVDVLEMDAETRTAEQAATAAGCALDQIVKSILLHGADSGRLYLFLTAGGNRVDVARASGLVGDSLVKADAAQVRAQTGFAIGGVAPVGLLTAVETFMDPRLRAFERVWAAGGTPRHVFATEPGDLARISGARLADFTV